MDQLNYPSMEYFRTTPKSFVLDFQGVLLLFAGTEHEISTHSRHRTQGLSSAQGNVTIRFSSVQQKFKTTMSRVEHLHLLHHTTVGNAFLSLG